MKILMIIAPEGYQDIEYETPKRILTKAGHEVITASTKEIAKGSLGGETKVDLLLDQVSPADYAGVIFIGGPGSHAYFNHEPALKLAKDFYKTGKITAAICAAPSILANAGILKGKTVTSFPEQRKNLENNGAIHTGSAVERDGLIITGSGPAAAEVFGKTIAEALASKSQSQ